MMNKPTTMLDSLNAWLGQALAHDERVLLMGEDIIDPYGGAFKVTRTLSDLFPERVIATPISEAGMVGVATGLALRGFLPVVEIMFGDFSTLIADQVINQLAKLRTMYAGVTVNPVVIRTPMGGRRGYGPTHSQSLEKLFLGIPGLRVIAPYHQAGAAGELLYRAILRQDTPVFFVENKMQYLLRLMDSGGTQELETHALSEDLFPAYHVRVRGAPQADTTIITYGYMAELAQQAMLRLAYENEVFIDLLVFTELSPITLSHRIRSVMQHHLVIAEEGPIAWGWGAEMAARLVEDHDLKNFQVSRVAGKGGVIPASPHLEAKILPQIDDIIEAVLRVRGK